MADILVVEDEDSLLRTLRYNLVRAGQQVRMCTDGAQAVDLIRGNPPNLWCWTCCFRVSADWMCRHGPIAGDGPFRLEAADLTVDVAARHAIRAAVELRLKGREFDLLDYLLRYPAQVLSRERLLRNVWGYESAGATRTVDVHARWLRAKIENDAPIRVASKQCAVLAISSVLSAECARRGPIQPRCQIPPCECVARARLRPAHS